MFTHVQDSTLASEILSGVRPTVALGNARNKGPYKISSTIYARLKKKQCRDGFGAPSARNLDLEGNPDLHLFKDETGRYFVFYADSADSGKGSGIEMVSAKAAFRFTPEEEKSILAFRDFMNDAARKHNRPYARKIDELESSGPSL